MQVIVVGAGLAGLVCARTLMGKGAGVVVLEAGDGVGGRVRTDKVDGFLLDRGFQVLFTSYPAAKRQLNLKALRLRRFDPGAIIAKGSRRYALSDPLRDPAAAFSSAVSPAISPKDKVLTALLALQLRVRSIEAILSGPDMTTEEYVRRKGFSKAYLENFVRPFYGGIYLERSMSTSAKCFKFDFKMLSEGFAAVPARGMGAIPAQLASALFSRGCIRLNTHVDSLVKDETGAVTGVRLADGSEMKADAVVLSVPAPEAARLSGHKMPDGRTSTVNFYWEGPRPLYRDNKIVLNANPYPIIDSLVQITNAAPSYAPPGRHLLSASYVGEVPEGDDETLFRLAEADIRLMFRGDLEALAALDEYRPLRLYRIPYGQFAQPPGIHPHLPDNISGTRGLFFAAEFTEASSQNAAMISGERAAQVILRLGSR